MARTLWVAGLLLCLAAESARGGVALRRVPAEAGLPGGAAASESGARISLAYDDCAIRGRFEIGGVPEKNASVWAPERSASCAYELSFTGCDAGEVALVELEARHELTLSGSWGTEAPPGFRLTGKAALRSLGVTSSFEVVLRDVALPARRRSITWDGATGWYTVHAGRAEEIPYAASDTRTRLLLPDAEVDELLGKTVADVVALPCGERRSIGVALTASGAIEASGPEGAAFEGAVELVLAHRLGGRFTVRAADGEQDGPRPLTAPDRPLRAAPPQQPEDVPRPRS